MTLWINGMRTDLPLICETVGELLGQLNLRGKVVIVELNETILDAGIRDQALLRDGDRVEMIHFVGGG
ncbi:hypothetical protein SY83_08615 [Paenibacillus swuensis]|uniref:Thiamine biosynthesis protein ThiS n=1 Tax=Paenibacillus swuensis TaxID=1178515 RepID=A0A172TGZ9_9BACL|nr:sulfur carrier protein ThiS [Paenibacillus swuensis]ANE46329.1 hypothetical protein SY83_08615 [Paenibacillus swuensis]